MSLEFGLIMTLIGVASVFSSLAVISIACVALKKFFKEETVIRANNSLLSKSEKRRVDRIGSSSFKIRMANHEHEVTVEDLGSDGKKSVEIMPPSNVDEEINVEIGNEVFNVKAERIDKIKTEHPVIIEEYIRSADESADKPKEVVTAPMQGTVVKIPVKAGDKIAGGSVVIVLETMKMENAIECDKSGVVKQVKVSEGDSVKEGDILVTIG